MAVLRKNVKKNTSKWLEKLPPTRLSFRKLSLRNLWYLPFGLWDNVCGYISQDPISLTATGNLSPSLQSLSPRFFRFACNISLCLANMIFPLLSIDIAGSSRPNYE